MVLPTTSLHRRKLLGITPNELVANEKTKATFWFNPPGVEVAEAFAVSMLKSFAASEYKAMFISPVGCLNFLKIAPPIFDLAYTSMSPPSRNNILVYAAIKVNCYTIGAASGFDKSELEKCLKAGGFEIVILKRKVLATSRWLLRRMGSLRLHLETPPTSERRILQDWSRQS